MMSSGLNAYQVAVLQEMGICVWQTQSSMQQAEAKKRDSVDGENLTEVSQATASSSPAHANPANSQARIAQLRSMLGNKPEKKIPEPVMPQDNAEQTVKPPVTEPIDPRSFGPAGQDIMQALSMFHDVKSVRWHYGSALSFENNILTLPYKTAPSDAAEKRRLWQVICAGK